MTEEANDPLSAFHGLASCPVCGCLSTKGTLRCPECGTFHAGHVMEERTPPSAEEREAAATQRAIDPSMYSLGPSSTTPEESFEESDSLTTWTGGSTDFSFEDEDDETQLKSSIVLPQPETVAHNEDDVNNV